MDGIRWGIYTATARFADGAVTEFEVEAEGYHQARAEAEETLRKDYLWEGNVIALKKGCGLTLWDKLYRWQMERYRIQLAPPPRWWERFIREDEEEEEETPNLLVNTT